MNESASYVDCDHWQYERNQQISAIPGFFIGDAHHRKYYPFGTMLPGQTTKDAYESGFMVKADSLSELADKMGNDAAKLEQIVLRFNQFRQPEKDLNFHRDESVYDRVFSNPCMKPNPNLGEITQPPFFAVKVLPGDLCTKGGLLTNECEQVLPEDGSSIPGLYVAGNTSASVIGRTYPGPGSTIGPAMVFCMIAGRHGANI